MRFMQEFLDGTLPPNISKLPIFQVLIYGFTDVLLFHNINVGWRSSRGFGGVFVHVCGVGGEWAYVLLGTQFPVYV